MQFQHAQSSSIRVLCIWSDMAAGILARDTEPFTSTKVVANTMWTSQPQVCPCTGVGRTVGCTLPSHCKQCSGTARHTRIESKQTSCTCWYNSSASGTSFLSLCSSARLLNAPATWGSVSPNPSLASCRACFKNFSASMRFFCRPLLSQATRKFWPS